MVWDVAPDDWGFKNLDTGPESDDGLGAGGEEPCMASTLSPVMDPSSCGKYAEVRFVRVARDRSGMTRMIWDVPVCRLCLRTASTGMRRDRVETLGTVAVPLDWAGDVSDLFDKALQDESVREVMDG
jgi:hypothetical protein